MVSTRKVVLYIAQSLDGYIATKDEDLKWLEQVEGEGDNGYAEFYETVDSLLMGRKTYDWLKRNVQGEFPYKGKDCFVFSRSLSMEDPDVTYINEDAVEFTRKLKKREGKNIFLVGGGELVNAFLKEKMVDEMFIYIVPVLIGSGIPLFVEDEDVFLEYRLKGMRRFNQIAELRYILKE